MKQSDKTLLRGIAKTQTWTSLPYGPNQEAIDRLVESGDLVYDPRCEAAMLPDVWERASGRVQRNADGWEALQRAENPEAHLVRLSGPPAAENAENAS